MMKKRLVDIWSAAPKKTQKHLYAVYKQEAAKTVD